MIALTDVACGPNFNGKMAYATHPEAETVFGCWKADNSNIHIRWDNGVWRSYDYSGWELPAGTQPPEPKANM